MAVAPGDKQCRDQLSRLDVLTHRLQRVCGEHADLVIDVARTAFDRFHPLLGFAYRQLVQLEAFPLRNAVSLQIALQANRGQCDACSPLGRLRILSLELSGSQAEGLGDLSADGHLLTKYSDHDFMCELGPVSWADGELGPGAGSGPVRLSAVPTDNPGFVRLLQVRQPACRHGQSEEFAAGAVRRWMCDLMRVCIKTEEAEKLNITGPASSFVTVDLGSLVPRDKDMVPCLRTPWWPADEFLKRSRALGWPSPAVVENIRQFGVHVVPTGCQQSDSALSEWRLSFSRAEVVVAWLLSQRQRHAVQALKTCKTAIGAPGKAIKSYFMKTSLLWLVQRGSADQWRSIREGAIAILRFLEVAISSRELPCFFWANINLFRFTTKQELKAMQCAVELMRQSLAHQLMLSCVVAQLSPVDNLLEDGGRSRPLSERQLRIRLARWLLVTGVQRAVHGLHMQSWMLVYATLAAAVPSITTTDLLRIHHLCSSNVQVAWFQALLLLLPTCRPADWPRLEVAANNTYTWDASLLVELLSDTDQRRIMVQSDAVLAWCERHQPAGRVSSPRSFRGRKELLLRPPLLQRAIIESVPSVEAEVRNAEANGRARYSPTYLRPSVEDCHLAELKLCGEDPGGLLRRRLGLDRISAELLAWRWVSCMSSFWGQSSSRNRRARATAKDDWQLRQYANSNYDLVY